MIEELFVWFLFFYGVLWDRPESLIGAGLFAIACNLKQMWKRKGET
jgi:hypothetical protein